MKQLWGSIIVTWPDEEVVRTGTAVQSPSCLNDVIVVVCDL